MKTRWALRSLRLTVPAATLAVSTFAISTFVVSTAGPASATEPSHPAPSQLRWRPCGEAYPGSECAVASVPLDYDDPRGARTGIQLARIKGARPARGTLFINPGGPGSSGVDLLLGGFGSYLSELLGGSLDIVGFDPRGVGASEPLICFGGSAELSGELLGGVPLYPYLPEQEGPYFEVMSAYLEQCGGQRIRAHMSTGDSARDLDQLRELVGDERLRYLGFSYGSFLGQTYANLFPDKVGSLVIDGVVDPTVYSSGLLGLSTAPALDDELDELLRLCDEAGAACALSGEDGAGARLAVVESALLEEPLELEEGDVFSYDVLIAVLLGSLYTPESDWVGPDGVAALLASLYDAVLVEPGAAERASAIHRALDARWAPASTFANYDNAGDAFYGITCADSEYPALLGEHSNIGILAGRDSALGSYWWWGYTPCSRWPLASDRYTGPWTAQTAAPVLIVGNYFDGVTDYAGALASSRLLPNSRLLSYAGWGHTALGYSNCVTEHTVRYLLDGTLPPDGTVCPANPNPFLQPPQLEPDSAGEGPELRAARRWGAQSRQLGRLRLH